MTRLGDGVVIAYVVGVLAIVNLAASSATRRVRASSSEACLATSEPSRAESVPDGLSRRRLPPNLVLPTGLRALAENVWRGSATFKRQCARLADVSAPTVTVRTGIRPLGSLHRARTVFTWKREILVAADVWIALQDDSVELLAHELEHVIEQLDRVDLARLADRRDAGVTSALDEIETRRAVAVGRIVAREFRAALVSPPHSVWHHSAGQTLTDAALARSADHACGLAAPVTMTALNLSPSDPRPSNVLVMPQGIRAAGTNSGPAVSVSADGRVVAFESRARLLSADTNCVSDIYVLDLHTRDLTLASQTPDGAASNGSSTHPGLSSDGSYIVFESVATNLVAAPDMNNESDIFVWDSLTGTTSRISVPPGQGSTNGWSRNPVIAADGESVAFDSAATNLIPGPDANGHGSDIYVFRVSTGLVRRVSVTTNGAQPSSGVSFAPAISADGRFIAFTSRAALGCASRRTSEPQRGIATSASHVYVRDLSALVTHCVSGVTGDGHGKGSSYHAAIDHEGRMVAFVSEAADLGVQDKNHAPDVYLHDLVTGATRLVTRSTRGRPANGDSLHPAISGNGRFVVFESAASDLVCARGCPGAAVDHNLVPDVYMFDVATEATTRLSTGKGDEPWWEASRGPSLSADGGTIAFSSRHPIPGGDAVDDDNLFVLMSWVPSTPPAECGRSPSRHGSR